MPSCTFFGHRDCPETVKPRLREVVTDLIVNHRADTFYVGNHGWFDAAVHAVLKEMKEAYPHINYAVVLAYMPNGQKEYTDYGDTILPEGIENIHPRFAVTWRNNWMLEHADHVVIYITHSYGGAAQFAQKAKSRGKTVINIAE